jgi:alginate biosynthesis protein AlgX
MIKSLKLIALTLAASFLCTTGVNAQNNPGFETCSSAEETEALFCPALKDESLYDKNGFESYKMLVPGKSGWIFRSESDFRTDFSIPKDTLDDIQELSDAFRAHGTELVMLITPTRAMMHSQYISDADKRKYNISNIDKVWNSYWNGIESLRARGVHVVGVDRPKDLNTPFFYRKDHHWNPYGAQIAAKAVAAYVKNLPAYKDVPKVQYQTREAGNFDFYGVSKKVFKRLCDTRQPPERITRKITERVDAATDQSDLFGETPQPEVVLMGTSNSTMEPSQANFEGFLNEELSADILNKSVSGGGLDTAMISYLNSDEFRDRPAKIAIWEIPGYYDLSNHKKFFREAIPASYGMCEAEPVAINKDIQISERNFIGIDKLAGRHITGDDYYVALDFSAPIKDSVNVDLRYVKNRDKYKFERSGRAAAGDKFYVSLADNKKENLDKIVLNVPDEILGKTVNVALCKKDEKTLVGEKKPESTEPKQASVVSVPGEIPGETKEANLIKGD